MKKDNKINIPSIDLPQGGGAVKGIGESFEAAAFTGGASLTIPLPVTSARDLTPSLNLSYNSGGGNGAFGLGFSLSLPSIMRRTDKGIPRYRDQDDFVLGGNVLVPKLVDGSSKRECRTLARDGRNWRVCVFLPRLEGSFDRIEQWVDTANGLSFWQVVDKANITSVYGASDTARVANPDDPAQIAEWLIEEQWDSKGNRILYDYKAEDGLNIPDRIYERNRQCCAQRYLQRIRYGNYLPSATEQEEFAFELVFDYGEYDLDDVEQAGSDPYTPLRAWPVRSDIFSSYRSGFEIRTYRLCRAVMLFHNFPDELGRPHTLVRATRLHHDETPSFSFLRSVEQEGYRPAADLAYERQALPPLDLSYTPFAPSSTPEYQQMRRSDGGAIPGYLNGAGFAPVDLNGEGLPGLLYSDDKGALYLAPEGDGLYGVPTPPARFPIDADLRDPGNSLADLDGDGRLELVHATAERGGYYAAEAANAWRALQPFAQYCPAYAGAAAVLEDLNGNGRPDLLQFDETDIIVNESLGTEGFEGPVRIPAANAFPLVLNGGPSEVLSFANVFGDGLAHRVKIRDGSVEVWPDLGYGHFAAPVRLANAPRFGDTLDARRLFLADIDGSGTVDLIYAYDDRVEIYRNESGNSFSSIPLTVALPLPYSQLSQINFADLRGNGTACMIITAAEPELRHYFCDLAATASGAKPYMLNSFDNNLGAKTEISYASSTEYYLADKRAGHPWRTRLPFPVQVVAQRRSYDLVSGAHTSVRYRYHDGYYDPVEREFRGFGFVEQWDAETLEEFSDSNPDFPTELLNQELFVPPVYTKSWFHTGAYEENGILSRQYAAEYFQGDPEAYHMPDSRLSDSLRAADSATQRQAYFALGGMLIRREVYGEDGSERQGYPFQVEESNAEVELYQPLDGNHYAVLLVRDRESISYNYERRPRDPRIEHRFMLDYDDFNNLTQECTVYYPRRSSSDPAVVVYPQQQELYATLAINSYINHPLKTIGEGDERLHFNIVGLPYEQQQYQLGGLRLGNGRYFSYADIKLQCGLALAQPIAYGLPFTEGQLQARTYAWQRSLFWDWRQEDALPPGSVTSRALLHHVETAQFTPENLALAFDEKLSADDVSGRGGYELQANGYWWNRGLVQYYLREPQQYFLPAAVSNPYASPESPLHRSAAVDYNEPYYLRTVAEHQLVGRDEDGEALVNSSQAKIDYSAMQYKEMRDSNDNVTQLLFNPLGMVTVMTRFGSEGEQLVGDNDISDYTPRSFVSFDAVINEPRYYLQGASAFYYYDFFAWRNSGVLEARQPVSAVVLQRQMYVSEEREAAETAIQINIAFNDGFGRVIEQKMKAGPGEAFVWGEAHALQKDDAGRAVRREVNERWKVSGRTVFNNKNKAAERYLPYFSSIPHYENQQAIIDAGLVPAPSIIHYDALGREIKIDTPKLFYTRVEFNAWEDRHYDENDTVRTSPYYLENINNDDPAFAAEKAALEQAAGDYNTPSISIYNAMGVTVLGIRDNLGQVPQDAFTGIVAGSPYSSVELWDDLLANGYLRLGEFPEDGAWLSSKFQPYQPGFRLTLAPEFEQFNEQLIVYLKEGCLSTSVKVDVEGRTLATADPRLLYANQQEGRNDENFRYDYAMGSDAPLYSFSADAGEERVFTNIFANEILRWNARSFKISTGYDQGQRPTSVYVSGDDGAGLALDQYVELMTYGEGVADAALWNLRGQIVEHKDQAGVAGYTLYTINGELACTKRRLRLGFRNEVNWNPDADEALQEQIYTSRLQYDALNRLLSEEAPDGSITSYSYNELGLPDSIALRESDGEEVEVVQQIDYDANDQRTLLRLDNGLVTRMRYEETTLRLTELSNERPAASDDSDRPTLLQKLDYTYDPVGNVTQSYDAVPETVYCDNQSVEARKEFSYDALYRLVRATGREHRNTAARSSSHLPLGHVTTPGGNARRDGCQLEKYIERFHYDDGDNLLETRHIAATNSWSRSVVIAPDSNRAFPEDSPQTRYDSAGNMLDLDNLRGIHWSYRNTLSAVDLIQRDEERSDSDYYLYDASGRRLRKIVERKISDTLTEQEDTVYIGNYQLKRIVKLGQESATEVLKRRLLRVMDGDTCVAMLYNWDLDALRRDVSQAQTRSMHYPLVNNLGSVTMELNEASELIRYEEYFPYGGTAITWSAGLEQLPPQEYGFTGKERDASTGLYYYGARYYISWLGRWLSPDPAGPVDGLNLYTYVADNPSTNVDPSGHCKDKAQPKSERVRLNFQQFARSMLRRPLPAPSPGMIVAGTLLTTFTVYGIGVLRVRQLVRPMESEQETQSKKTAYTLKKEAYRGALVNAGAEILEHSAGHQIEKFSSSMLQQGSSQAWMWKSAPRIVMGLPAASALYGSTTGVISAGMSIQTEGFTAVNTLNLAGGITFGYEAAALMTHRLALAGVLGFAADSSKATAAYLKGDYEKSKVYGAFALGNLAGSAVLRHLPKTVALPSLGLGLMIHLNIHLTLAQQFNNLKKRLGIISQNAEERYYSSPALTGVVIRDPYWSKKKSSRVMD